MGRTGRKPTPKKKKLDAVVRFRLTPGERMQLCRWGKKRLPHGPARKIVRAFLEQL